MATDEYVAGVSPQQKVSQGLNKLLSNSYGLMAQLHLAHWNVEGPDFFQLHEAFQGQYEELFEAVDEIAERTRALGVYSIGGLEELAKNSDVPTSSSAKGLPAKEFVQTCLDGHKIVIKQALELRDQSAELGDAETEDLVIGRIKVHQKSVWMLESYLADK